MPAQHNNATQPNSLHLLHTIIQDLVRSKWKAVFNFHVYFHWGCFCLCEAPPEVGSLPLEQLLRAQAWSWNAHSELHMFPLGVTVCSVHCATQRMTQCIMTHIYGTTLGVTGYNPTYNTMHCDTYTVVRNNTCPHYVSLCWNPMQYVVWHDLKSNATKLTRLKKCNPM